MLNNSGYDCEFVEKPPTRSECPICLLALREPQQATCCGKTFCKACICRIKEMRYACPTCKEEAFHYYPDKGLQQELYSCEVYCTKKSQSCDWIGELRDLDNHLNLNPSKEDKFNGCQYVSIKCSFCEDSFKRHELGEHETEECEQRPYSCELCKEYHSTYNDVVLTHLSICKCRQVECPSECGDAMEYHKLDEHLSSHCSLSEIECEFSQAGCEVKVLRKDLSSHMAENIASHMSLLALENRKLKSELEKVNTLIRNPYCPPLCLLYPWARYIRSTTMMYVRNDSSVWYSENFNAGIGGSLFRLAVRIMETPEPELRLSLQSLEGGQNSTTTVSVSLLDVNGRCCAHTMLRSYDNTSDVKYKQLSNCLKGANEFVKIRIDFAKQVNHVLYTKLPF